LDPGRGKRFFTSPQQPDQLQAPTASSPSSAKVKNEWSCTSTPPIHHHGVERDKIICLHIILIYTIIIIIIIIIIITLCFCLYSKPLKPEAEY